MGNIASLFLNRIRNISYLLVIIFIAAGFVTIHPGKSFGQGCEIGISKVATPDDGTEFHFVATGPASEPEFDLVSGDDEGLTSPAGSSVDIVEDLFGGWVLDHVECDIENAAVVTNIENGVRILCPPNGGGAGCTFFNKQLGSVPTLSQWGMIAAAAGLVLVGVFFAVRRRRITA